jgi:hypothetical protein
VGRPGLAEIPGFEANSEPENRRESRAARLARRNKHRPGADKHFEAGECQTVKDWKPCFRKTVKEEALERPSGIKKIEPEFSKVRPRAEKKHLRDEPADLNEPEYRVHMKTVYGENLARVQDNPTEEFNFHFTQLGRKIRVETHDKQRNGLEVRALGDKTYKKCEQSSGFYKEGGLITGSTNVSRIPHQGKSAANNDFATVLSYDATNPARTKWKDRERKIKEDEDSEAMRQLIEWEKTILKEANPKYVDPDLSDGD